MNTYLITGGAGFIGSHLTESLLDRGNRVIVLDDLSTGRLSNLDGVKCDPNLKVVRGSVLDELIVDELVHESDIVVHLAAAVGVKLIIEQPLRSFTTNIRGSEIVIGAAHRYRRKILVASTSEIYGKNGMDELHETADRILGSTTISRWSYSTAKAVDEILALSYHRERGLPAIVARLFNTVGPRQSPSYGMVIPRMVRQAVAGHSITVFGHGRQTRCFCHVRDVVAGLISLLDESRAVGEVFNVGANREISIRELAQFIAARANSESQVTFVPYEEAYARGFEDMQRRVPDTNRLRGLTGWTPKLSLEQIIEEAVVEARAEIAAPAPSDDEMIDLRRDAAFSSRVRV